MRFPRLCAVAVAAALALTGCGGSSTSSTAAGSTCEPINQYDTRCQIMAERATRTPRPQPVTLTRPHTVTYELTGSGTVSPTRVTRDASNQTTNAGDRMGQATAPWQLVIQAPSGTKPLIQHGLSSTAHCRILIDGVDVTADFTASKAEPVTTCGAAREP